MKKKINLKLTLTTFTICLLLIYLGTAFLVLQFNPLLWSQEVRGVTVYLVFVSMGIAIIINAGNTY